MGPPGGYCHAQLKWWDVKTLDVNHQALGMNTHSMERSGNRLSQWDWTHEIYHSGCYMCFIFYFLRLETQNQEAEVVGNMIHAK